VPTTTRSASDAKAQSKIFSPRDLGGTKDVLILQKTTYRYEDGKKFAMITFKMTKWMEGHNLGREP